MELNGIMIGSEEPKRLADYYSKVLGEPQWTEEGMWAWELGSAWLSVMEHDQVKGANETPGRILWNLESDDVPGEFERFKAAGATVVLEPYHPEQADEMWVATFSDPDGNYFQLMSPMPEPD